MEQEILGLAHIGIYTADIEKSKLFYIDHFGFRVLLEKTIERPDQSWLKLCFLKLNGMVIELLEPQEKSRIFEKNASNINHIAFEVINLDKVIENFKASGIQFETEQHILNEALGIKMIFLRGLNDERLELLEYLK